MRNAYERDNNLSGSVVHWTPRASLAELTRIHELHGSRTDDWRLFMATSGDLAAGPAHTVDSRGGVGNGRPNGVNGSGFPLGYTDASQQPRCNREGRTRVSWS